MASIAKAYVQVIPSAEGIKGKLTSIMGKEMPSGGKSAGSLFGSSLIGQIKGIIATAGIGKVLTDTVMAGANLQQSLGGVETLFKENAQAVIDNANNAYRTAGLSANAYMEQVTSFSASLLQSLSGDTAKAATVADMALTDMSDNANKFGTDMERITDAYQGFAKGNYTMLDNLKLGYGGTKTEMERLLADARKLTGVKYDINNLSDVYSAIHAIQGKLGVTGTTAAEASKTISGSFSAMKSAFTNVLGNLALGNAMEPSLNALAQTTATFLTGNLIPMVWNIVTALPGALVTFIDTMIPGGMQQLATTVVVKLSAFLRGGFPTLLSNGVQMIAQMATGFLNGIPGFLEQVGYLLNMLLSAIMSQLPGLLSSGATLILTLAQGLQSAVPQIIASGISLIGSLLSTFAQHLPDFLAQGISMIGQLIAGSISMIPDIIQSGKDIASDLLDAIIETDWLQLGVDIINGIIQGLWNAATSLYNAVREIIRNALQAGKGEAETSSPSRLFRRELGQHLPTGAALGVRDNAHFLEDAMTETVDSTASAFRSRLRTSSLFPGKTPVATAGRSVVIHQYIYSEAKTAAELMSEARYQAEKAVLLGV